MLPVAETSALGAPGGLHRSLSTLEVSLGECESSKANFLPFLPQAGDT